MTLRPGSRTRALSAIVDRDTFEDHVKHSFVDQKKNGSKMMTQSGGPKITDYLYSTLSPAAVQQIYTQRRPNLQ